MDAQSEMTPAQVRAALKRHAVWDLGNEMLYDLCRAHPGHRTHEEILAKVWLIGRSYATSIERRDEDLSVPATDVLIAVCARRHAVDVETADADLERPAAVRPG